MDIELALTTILAVVVLLLLAAQFTRVPYPILLVIGGLGLAALPPIPDVELDPDLVLIVILPPLLYSAAYFTPLRELRRNVREISALAIGLVLATMVGVALRRPLRARLRLGSVVRARCDRLAHRPGRSDRDRPPPRCSRHGSSRSSRASR